jgi:hypothetical protein
VSFHQLSTIHYQQVPPHRRLHPSIPGSIFPVTGLNTMQTYADSTDRRPSDFLLFAIGFAGFWIGAAGVVLASAPLALFGVLLLLLSVYWFGCRSGASD